MGQYTINTTPPPPPPNQQKKHETTQKTLYSVLGVGGF